jgi:A/G-specific adenine glycosylase
MNIRNKMDAVMRRKFRRRLLAWYGAQARELPWRGERDPYRVWISEIMLQQTRVNAVREYYARFLSRFPTVEELARASESKVLAGWSGLGYYRRARALHAAAREIVRRGRLPRTSVEWRMLPGIGRYTASAIASIAFGEAVPVVDGNVSRVLTRIAGSRAVDAWKVAEELLSRRRPGDFNQAMMDLGATVCLPRAPKCNQCPVMEFCATRGHLAVRPAPPRKRKTVCYGVRVSRKQIWLMQRPESASLMPGMWELPQLESSNGRTPRVELRHSITTTDYRVRVYVERNRVSREGSVPGGRWVKLVEVEALPLTGLTRKILRRLEII